MQVDKSHDRVSVVVGNLDRYLAEARPAAHRLAPDEPLRPGSGLTARRAIELFEDQAASRALDIVARELKRDGQSYYTISSAGHEQNAILGALLRPDVEPLPGPTCELVAGPEGHLLGVEPIPGQQVAEVAQRRRVRPVGRGRHTGLEAEIVSGLEPGEQVVLYPNERVADGVRVAAR